MGYSDNSSDSELEGPVVSSEKAHFDDDKLYLPHRSKSLAGIAMGAFLLGASLATSLIALVLVRLWYPSSPHWRHGFYGTTLSFFHFLEFWATAKYDTSGASARSFFPTKNVPAYLMAHSFAFLECLVWRILFFNSRFKLFPGVIGLVLLTAGQLVRTLAVVQAGSAISRNKETIRERDGLVLVMTGVYGIMRHPAYFGFFWWAIGTQLVLGNIFSLLAAVVGLWSIFAGRVKREEESLRRIFGSPYQDYKKRVGTWMPFIG